MELGFAALEQHDLRWEALPEMQRLARQARLNVNLAKLDGQDTVSIAAV